MDTPPTPNPHQWTQENQRLGIKLLHTFDNLSEDEKHDIVQDFWLTGKDKKFEGKSKFSTYYCRVLINRALDYIRKRDQLRIDEENRTLQENVGEADSDLPQPKSPHPTQKELFAYVSSPLVVPGLLEKHPKKQFILKHLQECDECLAIVSRYKKAGPEKIKFSNMMIISSMILRERPEMEKLMATVDEAIKAKQEYEQKKDSAIKELLENRKKIDQQLVELGHGNGGARKKGQRACSNCGKVGHNIARCDQPKKKTTPK